MVAVAQLFLVINFEFLDTKKSCVIGTMVISNCLFSLTLKIPLEFSARCILAKLSACLRKHL